MCVCKVNVLVTVVYLYYVIKYVYFFTPNSDTRAGSYQPSNDMLLRFYAYFKQATLGPCKQQRPAFWNVVDK